MSYKKIKCMKRVVLLSVFVAFAIIAVKADPAKKVNLSFQNGKLKVEAIHKVKDVKKHFIDQIVIKVDGKEVKTISLKSQSSTDAEIIEVPVPEIKKGSKVEVTTRCNEFGLKSGKLTVE